MVISVFFFFQAEDGIRDPLVTGVQTCALPIYRGIHEVVDVAEPGDRATAADQEHVAVEDRPRDLTDDSRRTRPVDGRGPQNDRVQAVRRAHPADLSLGMQLRLRIPVSKPRGDVGLVDPLAAGIAVDICRAEMDEPLHGCTDGGFEQVPRTVDVGASKLPRGGPVRYQRAAVEDVTAALRGIS